MSITLRNICVAVLSAIGLLTTSCSDDDFIMNSSFIDSDTYAVYTDQTSIELSTFRLDSVLTSGLDKVWVGACEKPVIGTVYSESYIKLAEPDDYDWITKEKYDSVTIVLRHTGESEGDTTQSITIDVHRLAQPIRFAENESSFYNVRSFRDSTSIGTFTFKPRPHTRPRVRFRLSDEFGEELVSFIKTNQSSSSDVASRNFENFLGGIKVTFSGEPSSLLCFLADSCFITLHSHMPLMQKVRIERRLLITESEKQFNHIWNEDAEEPYNSIENRYDQVTETDGGQHSVMFEGLGYYTRVNFPTLEELVTENYFSHIAKATLTLYAERDSYDKRDFPSTFYLTEINKGNVLQNPLYTSSGYLVSSTLVNNILDEDRVYYSADITYYINTVVSQEYIEQGAGIVLTWGSDMDATNYYFMLFNGNTKAKFNSKLELYYYNYDREQR